MCLRRVSQTRQGNSSATRKPWHDDAVVDSRTVLIELARRIVIDPPLSVTAANEIEERLRALDQPETDDLVEALCLYSPGNGPRERGLIGEPDLIRAARLLLHGLDDHAFCLHGVPLAERP